MSDTPLPPLPRFQHAIKSTPVRQVKVTTDTYYRYRDGQFPKAFVRFLIDNPDLAQEFCADILELANEPDQQAA